MGRSGVFEEVGAVGQDVQGAVSDPPITCCARWRCCSAVSSDPLAWTCTRCTPCGCFRWPAGCRCMCRPAVMVASPGGHPELAAGKATIKLWHGQDDHEGGARLTDHAVMLLFSRLGALVSATRSES